MLHPDNSCRLPADFFSGCDDDAADDTQPPSPGALADASAILNSFTPGAASPAAVAAEAAPAEPLELALEEAAAEEDAAVPEQAEEAEAEKPAVRLTAAP